MKFLSTKILVASLISAVTATCVVGQVANFDSLNGYAAGVETRIVSNRETLVHVQNLNTLSGLTLSGQYIDRTIKATADRIERDTNGRSGTLGYGWNLGTWGMGIRLTADTTTSDYTEVRSPAPVPLHGVVDADTLAGQLWVGGNFGSWHVNLALGAGKTDHDGTRISDIGSSRASFDSTDKSVQFQVSYEHATTGKMAIRSMAGISNINAQADGFTETGTSPDRRIVRDFKARETMGLLGLQLAAKEGDWVPSVTVAWLHEFSENDTRITNSAINGANLGSGLVPNTAGDLFYANVRLDGRMSKDWVLSSELQYVKGGSEKQWGFQLGIKRVF